MPEVLPVTRRINVMVGITRSKVYFFLSLFFSGWRPLPQMGCRGVGGLRLAAMDGGWFGIFWNNILCSGVKDKFFGSS